MNSETEYEPPFHSTAEIGELLLSLVEKKGELKAMDNGLSKPWLHRKMRIKTIHSSLAIEGNRLSEEQVVDVVDGKRVVGSERDILEVKNAAAAYDMLDELDPLSPADLLRVHRAVMKGLVGDAGCYRAKDVGVHDEDVLIHAGTPAAYVPEVMNGLFSWLAKTSLHPVISSSIFHYELEFIHPFSDGNGRTGRLWHTLLLARWRSQFKWLPIESAILSHQNEYYGALAASNREGSCNPFVEMMLQVINEAIDGWLHPGTKRDQRLADIVSFVSSNPGATYEELAALLGVTPRTVARDMEELRSSGALKREGSRKNGRWVLKSKEVS